MQNSTDIQKLQSKPENIWGKRMQRKLKAGDVFVSEELVTGRCVVRIVINIENNNLSYCNNFDEDEFMLPSETFCILNKFFNSIYLGNILS